MTIRALLLAMLSCACQPELVVGTWKCPATPREPNDAGVLLPVTGPVPLPWSTGFEQGFCDYDVAEGFCYVDGANASLAIVDAPVHAGKHAAAFTIDTDFDDGQETRCVREGTLPPDATYGAWYYVPEVHEGIDNWNLLHIQGGEVGGTLPTLWDVSLESGDDGELHLYVFNALGTNRFRPAEPQPIPIGTWFHIEFRLLRAADATGAIALYQDEALLVERTGIRTDNTTFGQWYVGNLANALAPPASTVYVDDITISPTP